MCVYEICIRAPKIAKKIIKKKSLSHTIQIKCWKQFFCITAANRNNSVKSKDYLL